MQDVTKQFNELKSQITDIEENIVDDKIKVLKVYAGAKNPVDDKYYIIPSKLENYNYNGNEYTGLRHHKGNYGVCVGYNHEANGESLGGIDIDGYKLEEGTDEEKEEVKQFTKQQIYECLKKELPNSLQVSTQSNGFHLYLWNKTINPKIHITSESLYFPSDFPIKKLRNKCLNSSIEIFTKFKSKQMVLPSSKTNEGEYNLIGNVNKLADVERVDDLNKAVIDALVKHGYTYKPKTEKTTTKPKTQNRFKTKQPKNNNLKELDKKEIKQVVKMVAPLFKTINDEKHLSAMALGGFFSNNISFESASKIANGVIHQVGSIFDSNAGFKKTILKNYTERADIQNKTGLPKFCEYVLKKDKNFNVSKFMDEINAICNKSFVKEIVGDVFINGNQIPIVLYENQLDKWLKYEGVFNGIDLILNFGSNIGAFRYGKTKKEIVSFKFKFKDKFFDIQKKELEPIYYFLTNINEKYKLPAFFVETIRISLNQLEAYATNPKQLSNEVELKNLFANRNRESYARKQLGNYLYENGVILRKSINQPYKYNGETNGFDSVEIDDIIIWLNNCGDFEPNSISSDDIENALKYIGDRKKPTYNIVKFKNCLYDMENFKIIEETEEPVLTLTEVLYNYNPNAKGEKIRHFLETSLKQRDDTPDQLEERIVAFFEFVGYILTSGNRLNCWFIFAGIGGAGKGVATNIITAIFGSNKVGHLQIQELTTENRFATSNLVNKQINIVTDSPKKPIEETGLLKAITGFDDIPIEFKGKDKSNLPKEEVPQMLTVCNNAPKFADGFDMQIIQRIIIFEFLNQFRGTENQNKDLLKEILADPQELEYLLFNGIAAYKDMIQNNREFKARVSEEKTIELLGKHTNPIGYLLPKLVNVNFYASKDGEEPVIANELNQLLLYVAKQNGLSITAIDEKRHRIKPKTLLNEIRKCFDFEKEYTTNTTKDADYKTVKYYPNLCKTNEYEVYLLDMEEEQFKKEQSK